MIFNKENAIEEFRHDKSIQTYILDHEVDELTIYNNWLAKDIECPRCKGTGKIPISFPPECTKCQGKGTIPKVMRFIE